jgi:predicted RNA methylase
MSSCPAAAAGAGVGRFDLNVQLMDKASKAAAADLCRELLEVLQQAVQRAPAVQQQQQQTQQQQGAAQLLADLQASMVKLRV